MVALEDWIYETQLERWIKFLNYLDNKFPYPSPRNHGINPWYKCRNVGLSKFVKWDTIIKNPNLDREWFYIVKNPNLTWENIRDNIKRFTVSNSTYYWINLAMHPSITWDIIQDNPQYPWNPIYVSRNPNITWDIIQENPDYPWDWFNVSLNPNIKYEHYKRHPKKKEWDWNILEFKKRIELFDWSFLQTGRISLWQRLKISIWGLWYYVSSHPNITWDFIKNNINYPWCWNAVSENPNITLDIIRNNPDIEWDIYYVSKNTGLVWNELIDSIEKDEFAFNYNNLKYNSFDRQLNLIKLECITKWYAANRIRKWWLFKIYLNPFHPVGQRRLERSYQEMLKNDI